MKNKKLIPFSWLPASWGLVGKTRKIAEAEYYLSGEQLDRRLAEIQHSDPDQSQTLQRENMRIDLKYNKIDQAQYDESIAVMDACNDDEAELRRLKVRLDHDKISQHEYEKRVAEIKQEPWVNVISMGVDPEQITQGFFELDWNDEFVKMLQNAGITGTSDEDIVNKWFNGVCRTVLLQEGADLDYGLQQGTVNGQNSRNSQN